MATTEQNEITAVLCPICKETVFKIFIDEKGTLYISCVRCGRIGKYTKGQLEITTT
jgi:Zn ribbon nucleic-acid-binding protein